MEFLIFEDNGGAYQWKIVDAAGATLARSGSFACYDDAEQAAERVRGAAASALFQHRATVALPVDLIARRDAGSDHADAERWLDERGSFSSEAFRPPRDESGLPSVWARPAWKEPAVIS
jgi:uncharacterized protein YegP (UPF0339 family)